MKKAAKKTKQRKPKGLPPDRYAEMLKRLDAKLDVLLSRIGEARYIPMSSLWTSKESLK